MLRKQATRKLELQQQLDEKLVQKDYAGAAMIQEQLKEDCMPLRSAGEGATSSVLPTLRMQELGQRLEDALKREDYAGVVALQEEINLLGQADEVLRN